MSNRARGAAQQIESTAAWRCCGWALPFLAAVVISVLVSLPLAQQLGDLSGRDYLVAAGFGLGPMTLGMMLYVIGSRLLPSTLTALINTMEAPLGAAWAWVGVGEAPALETVIGGGIVIGAVFWRLLRERKSDTDGRAEG